MREKKEGSLVPPLLEGVTSHSEPGGYPCCVSKGTKEHRDCTWRAIASVIKQVGIDPGIRIELDQHPQQHGRAISIIDAVVIFPVSHHSLELMLSLVDELIIPFLYR